MEWLMLQPGKKQTTAGSMEEFQGQVLIYSIMGCQQCMQAKNTLQGHGIPYIDVILDTYPEARAEMQRRTQKNTVPQIFFNSQHIGGNKELQELIQNKAKWEEMIQTLWVTLPGPDAPRMPTATSPAVTATSSVAPATSPVAPATSPVAPATSPVAPATSPAAPATTSASPGSRSSIKYTDLGDIICEPDEYAGLVMALRSSGIIKDHKVGLLTIHKQSFTGTEFVDWVVKEKCLDRDRAVEMGQALIDRHFGHHLKNEETFQDSPNVFYRLLEDDESHALNAGPSDCEPRPAKELGEEIRKLILKIYSKFLSADGKKVNYKGIASSLDFAHYIRLSKELVRVHIADVTKEEKLAFFINVYNAQVIHANIIMGPPVNLWQRYKFFNTVRYIIGGYNYSLHDIENGILRANRKGIGMFTKPFGSSDPRLKVALTEPEPLIHFALVCGAKSCPPIKIYSAEKIYDELQLAANAFLEGDDGCEVDMTKRMIKLSKVFMWYSVDFGKHKDEVVEWVHEHLAEGKKKSQVGELLKSKNYKLAHFPYNWSTNA